VSAEELARSARMIEGLRKPDAYHHAVREPIRVAETHISWVLLTGEFAYKVKKPLRLSFLDYSDAAERRRLCEEEVRLNRRYAPDLYLGVTPITGPPDAPRMDGPGPTLDHAVRMRQFAPEDELASLLEQGAVSSRELTALGREIARFHAAAALAPDGSPYGTPQTVIRVTRDNFAELGPLPELRADDAGIDELEAQLVAGFESRLPKLQARRRQGWIRECHGDLHCGNVVRWQGSLTPFDGIEFDPALRFVDVVNDVAFLTMDLSERGHPELRHAVLQAWLESLGDFPGLALLPCYEAYRALVRAKVATLRALQDNAERRRAVTDCRRYLHWARRRIRPAPRHLAITCGLSGSGKTRLAQHLGAELRWLCVRSDVERKRLAGLGPLDDSRSSPGAGIYTAEFNVRTYARLLECADAALGADESIVVDAAFLRRDERDRFRDLARRHGVDFLVLHCHAPTDVLRERVETRRRGAADASEADLDVLARQPSCWEAFDPEESASVLGVDTSVPTAVTDALRRVRERTAG